MPLRVLVIFLILAIKLPPLPKRFCGGPGVVPTLLTSPPGGDRSTIPPKSTPRGYPQFYIIPILTFPHDDSLSLPFTSPGLGLFLFDRRGGGPFPL